MVGLNCRHLLLVILCVELPLAHLLPSMTTKDARNPFNKVTTRKSSTLPPNFKPSKLVAKCGQVFYMSRQKICCGDQLFNRTGFKPNCCGSNQYDAMFDICCKEKIIQKISHPLNC